MSVASPAQVQERTPATASRLTSVSPNASKLNFRPLSGRAAIVSGSTRGIGRECALALARQGCSVVIAGKSLTSTKELPGDIYSVAAEVRSLGAEAISVQLDVLDEKSIQQCVEACVKAFGSVDICVNNASALWWQPIEQTPAKKYDLINRLNARGSFLLTQACLPYMRQKKWGRVVCMSPPIETEMGAYKGLTAYNISKMGMTMVALGAAAEGAEHNILGNSLWPATVIESQASINFDLGERKLWRRATILADCAVALCCDDSTTGQMLIDDEYLLDKTKFPDMAEEDLKTYRYDPLFEPPRLLADKIRRGGGVIQRGDVRKVKEERKKDKLEEEEAVVGKSKL